MLSFEGCLSPEQTHFDLLQLLKPKISAAKKSRGAESELKALILDLSAAEPSFLNAYASLLLSLHESLAYEAFKLKKEESPQLEEILKCAVKGYELIYDWAKSRSMPITNDDRVEVIQSWVKDNGDEVGESSLRMIQKTVLREYKAKSLSLVETDVGDEIAITLVGRRRFDDATGEHVSQAATYLFMRDLAKKMSKSPLAGTVNLAMEFMMASGWMLESMIEGVEYMSLFGVEIVEGVLTSRGAEEPAQTGQKEIRVTEEAKYPIGLFG